MRQINALFAGRRAGRSACRIVSLSLLVCFLAGAPARGGEGAADADAQSRIERGAFLVKVAACSDCHTPMDPAKGGPDMSRFFSGHPASLELPPPPKPTVPHWIVVSTATNTAWSGPWGITYASNLTPDVETGIGGWGERMFIDTMKTGLHGGIGRPLLPPMPVEAYRDLSEEDCAAMYAYFMSLRPINNRVPEYAPPAPATE